MIGDALTVLLKSRIKILGSGRTDAGVHAIRQVAHFDSDHPVNVMELTNRLNRFLPDDISILKIYPVNDKAHARFSAISRSYEYRIALIKNPFTINRTWYLRKALDLRLLNEASEVLMEYRDFESFSRVKTDVNHFRCEISEAKWKKKKEEIVFSIRSDRFLRGMVRAIVGTMVEISQQKITLGDFRKIIEAKNRRKAGPAAPACGLYLTKVEYPPDILVKL